MAGQAARTAVLRLVKRALLFGPIAGLLMAPTCDQSFSGSSGTSSNPQVAYRAFGDSIPAGNLNSGSSSAKSYVGYFADDIAAAKGWYVTYDAKTVSGETTSQINNTMRSNTSRMGQAKIFSFNGGGNDLLDARAAYASNCNASALATAMNNWRSAWDAVITTVDTYVPANAAVRTMTLYYPDPNRDKNKQCSGQRNHFEVLLPHGLAASDYMCSTAQARGWRCADAFTVMNCDEDVNGNPSPRCPNKAWLENLAAGACPRGASGMMDHNCIRNHLDVTGDWAYFKDPSSLSKGLTSVNLIQGDYVHPNQAGHDRLGAAHHALGYDDCGACPAPYVAPVCGDGTCNGTETCSSCGNDCGVCAAGINETNMSVAQGAYTATFTLTATNPRFRMSGGTGDADLYVRLGSTPTTSSYTCRSWATGNNETCNMTGTGTWYVRVHGYTAASGFNLWSE